MHTPVMTCRELADFILAYLNGELAAPDRDAFELHLSRCPNCVQYLASYRSTTELGRRAFCEDSALAMPDDLVRAILQARAADRS